MNASTILSAEWLECFRQDGFLLIHGFYDVGAQIEPIQQALYEIIGLLILKNSRSIERKAISPELFDAGYQSLIAHDRKLDGEAWRGHKLCMFYL